MQEHHTPEHRPRLSDVLAGGVDSLRDQWNEAQAAADFKPLPAGTYTARVVSGQLFTSKNSTPGYKLAFRVLEDKHAGRQFWHDLWFTSAALPMAKRDLGKLGVTEIEQLDRPLPQGIRCTVTLALRRSDNGAEFNRVSRFEVIAIDDDPTLDGDFAPSLQPPSDDEGDQPSGAAEETDTPAEEAEATDA